MEFAQLCDLVDPQDIKRGPLDVSAFPGTWVNSNPHTSGIARLVVSESNGKISLQTFAIGPNGLIDWGVVDVVIFTSNPNSHSASGFTCRYNFGFAETQLEGMIMKGLLVLAQFHIFKDGSGRTDYFAREYFALMPSHQITIASEKAAA